MKTVILAGGLGTRLSEETTVKPKPMVEIGGKPLLWHIMNIYASHGHQDFVVACGYRGEAEHDRQQHDHDRVRGHGAADIGEVDAEQLGDLGPAQGTHAEYDGRGNRNL